MKISLKQILQSEIKDRGYLPLDEVHTIASEQGHKQSTAERKLRHSESPTIQAVENDKGMIIGYQWIGEKIEVPNNEIVSDEELTDMFGTGGKEELEEYYYNKSLSI